MPSDVPTAPDPSGGPSATEERMRSLLSRAVQDQVSEQRALTETLQALQAQVEAVGEQVRGTASGEAVAGGLAELARTVSALHEDVAGRLAATAAQLETQHAAARQDGDRLGGLVDGVRQHATALGTAQEQLGTLHGQLATVQGQLAAVREQLAALPDADASRQSVSAAVETLSAPLARLEERLGAVATDQAVRAVLEAVAELGARPGTEALGPRLDLLLTAVRALPQTTDIGAAVGDLVQALEERIDRLDAPLQQLRERPAGDALRGDVGGVAQAVRAQGETVQGLAGTVARADALQGLAETVARADALQGLAETVARADALQGLTERVATADALAGLSERVAGAVQGLSERVATADAVQGLSERVATAEALDGLAERVADSVQGLSERAATAEALHGLTERVATADALAGLAERVASGVQDLSERVATGDALHGLTERVATADALAGLSERVATADAVQGLSERVATAETLAGLADTVARADALQGLSERVATADALAGLADTVARADAVQALADDVARRTDPLARAEALDALADTLRALADDLPRRTGPLARAEAVDALAADVARRGDLDALADRLSAHVSGQLADRFTDLPDSRGLAADLGGQLGARLDDVQQALAPVPDRTFVVEALQALEERLGQRIEARIGALEERLLAAVARTQDERPDVVAVRSQVEGLESSVLDGLEGVVQGVATVAARLLDRLPEAGLLERTADGVARLAQGQAELADRVAAPPAAPALDGLADLVARRVGEQLQQAAAAQVERPAEDTPVPEPVAEPAPAPAPAAPENPAAVEPVVEAPPAPPRVVRPPRPAVDTSVAPRLPR